MSKKKGTLSLSTLAIHGGGEMRHAGDPVVAPLVQSVNYVQEVGTGAGLKYTRYGNTPNAERVQKRIAMLEGAEAALVLSSGMGATACAMLALLRPGDHLLASAFIYGGTHRLFTEEFSRHGIDVTLVDPLEPRAWRRRLRKETRAIFIESPVNPTCRLLDLKPISYLAKEAGLALVVDSTFASPVNFRPIEHGADVVIHSATKYLNGHHDVLSGVVAGTESYIQEVLQKEMVWDRRPTRLRCGCSSAASRRSTCACAGRTTTRSGSRSGVPSGKRSSACITPDSPAIRITRSPARRSTVSAACSRSSFRAAEGRRTSSCAGSSSSRTRRASAASTRSSANRGTRRTPP